MNGWLIGGAMVALLALARPRPKSVPGKPTQQKPSSSFGQESPNFPQGRLAGTVPAKHYSNSFSANLRLVENSLAPQFAGVDLSFGTVVDLRSLGGAESRKQNITRTKQGTNADAQKLKALGELILIESYGDLRNVAKLFAAALFVQSKDGVKPLPTSVRTYLRQAQNTIKMTDQFKMDMCRDLARRLAKIGGVKTDGWVPQNQGIFGPGVNNYTVPSKLERDLLVELLKRSPLEFALELAIAEAVNVGMRESRGETNPLAKVIEGAGKVLGKAVSKGAAGASAGPWGAVVGAIEGAAEEALKLAFKGVIEATEKVGKEAALLARLERGLQDVRSFTGNPTLPLNSLGYGMNVPNSNVPAWLPIRSPFNIYWQRAAQILGFNIIAQGVYEAPGLYAWAPFFGSVQYAFTMDAADDLVPSGAFSTPLRSKP